MKTPSAESEDIPSRIIELHVHLGEAMELEQCVRYFCQHAPKYFDLAPHRYRMRDLICVLRASIEAADPEYAKQMFDAEPPTKAPDYRHRELHYHPRPPARG